MFLLLHHRILAYLQYCFHHLYNLVAIYNEQLDYKCDESSIVDWTIPDGATIKTLEELGPTITFIDIWLKLLREKFDARCDAYINAIKVMFRQISQTIKIALTG